ncbi:phosphotransferase family protein [Amycolatopsis sp. GM8]|uniref:phosphotransferase family protein n=1 Tax=Amycolatopsis sp. GM8 TaxID=2896530 RepID=UPI001F3E85E3|nr:phosphotransferase family protein [Amycolatopsis sp. GM8]
MGADDPPNLPLDRLGTWLEAQVPKVVPPLIGTLVAGGRSNLTYRLIDACGRSLALRRPPAHTEVPGAHDMVREFRILRSLAERSRVHVPTPLAFCRDTALIGVSFYVMEFVEGIVARDPDTAAALPESARRTAAFALVDELVELHLTDAADVGLGDLGRSTGYVERELQRWSGQISGTSAASRLLAEVHTRLVGQMPPQRRTALVHGDYGLDNAIFAANGELRAVLDWELCTRGDPLADLGWLLLFWQPESDLTEVLPRGTTLRGFPGRQELTSRYAAATGAELRDLSYYVGLAAWRLAIITLGVASRYRTGGRAGSDVDIHRLNGDVERLAIAASRHV